MRAVNQVPANSVLLFEDIDCMRGSQSREEPELRSGRNENSTIVTKENASTNVVTLSGLLNVLDGFHAPSGVLFVMTTNHLEKLDPALLRPGRIDYRLFLGKASDRQKVELYRRFFPDASEREAGRRSLGSGGSESRNPGVENSPVVMCDGSFEGRRFESCHSLWLCSSIGRARPLPTIPRRVC
jgi:hypothetical protein